ncbi:uncharacterized protein ARMOST_22193 [Armillaria ostoyae]|uniref:Uncharacterized protein n=1 Tax=Armillaria ostoyae TaxID=47428 RepID=A0A284SC75_ARMOS|nr:uncharacterized protein ARMOST_22193 [Armillaria ostoyae]
MFLGCLGICDRRASWRPPHSTTPITPIDTRQGPRNRPKFAIPPPQQRPHRHRGQSLPHTNSAHYESVLYVWGSDIGRHLGTGGPTKRTTDDEDGNIEHDDDDDYGDGGFLLRGGALALSWGGLTRKERRDGGSRRAGDVERDGGIKIGTSTPNDSDDKHTLLDIEGGPSGAMNSARIMAIRRFACPPLPTPPKANNALPHSTHAPHTPQSRVAPIIWVGEHDPAVRHCPRCFRRRASPPHSHPRHFCPIPTPTA